jgi:hypothetical protein
MNCLPVPRSFRIIKTIISGEIQMSENKYTIVESWPMLKEDLISFLSDTDAWVIAGLKQAKQNKKWDDINKIIDIMESVHNLAHSHGEIEI